MSNCYRCGTSLDSLPLPIGRRESCPQWNYDVRVCRNCKHYDPKSYNECRETMAERVVDKEKSNTCDYFVLGTASASDAKNAAEEAMKKLNDLFK